MVEIIDAKSFREGVVVVRLVVDRVADYYFIYRCSKVG